MIPDDLSALFCPADGRANDWHVAVLLPLAVLLAAPLIVLADMAREEIWRLWK